MIVFRLVSGVVKEAHVRMAYGMWCVSGLLSGVQHCLKLLTLRPSCLSDCAVLYGDMSLDSW